LGSIAAYGVGRIRSICKGVGWGGELCVHDSFVLWMLVATVLEAVHAKARHAMNSRRTQSLAVDGVASISHTSKDRSVWQCQQQRKRELSVYDA
jgi:hypothetical protein